MRYNVIKKNMPKLQLIYFNLKALLEAPRMMMHRADVEYSNEMAWDYYKKPWSEVIINGKEYTSGTNPNNKYL